MGDVNIMLANRLAMISGERPSASSGGDGGDGGGGGGDDDDKEYRPHPTNPDMMVEVKQQQPAAVKSGGDGGGGGGKSSKSGKSGKRKGGGNEYAEAPASEDLSCWQSLCLCLQENRTLSIYLGTAFFSLVPGIALINATSKSSLGYVVGTFLLGVFVLQMMFSVIACFGSTLQWCCLHDAENHACFNATDVCRCRIGFCYKERQFYVPGRSRKVYNAGELFDT